ncbi:hypothetical protein ENSA5_38150 [Enhygromyxa salina]|uniref:Uncharacterized protein n=1 Tax=Enhygromyxa salina TaxID=215803 RepID=A0A2S9XRP1_9BACT|nr:hypothetical protein [Enhygromyxa salina]PRP95532.1 hypothetical protein ENSA5_38150 [Enhygromyxa salina]
MVDEPNPYAPPRHDEPAPTQMPNAQVPPELERLRQEHINAETNVKTLGVLLYIGAASTLLSAVGTVAQDPAAALISLVVGVGLGLGGFWLRRLDRRGRAVYSGVIGLSVVVLVIANAGQPFTYLAGRMFWPLLFLGLLWGTKASTVMSPHYRDVVIPATPHVKRKTSRAVIAIGVLLLLLIVALVVAGMLE